MLLSLPTSLLFRFSSIDRVRYHIYQIGYLRLCLLPKHNHDECSLFSYYKPLCPSLPFPSILLVDDKLHCESKKDNLSFHVTYCILF
jgi:hypothetical protein